MSIGTHVIPGVNGSPESLPTAAPARSMARPRNLLRLPVFAAPQPEGTDDPVDPSEENRRASGARCRIAMGYLD